MNDNELIYLTKTEGLKNAKWLLNQKYLAYIKNLEKRYGPKWFNRPFSSYYENLSNAFITLGKCIDEFDFKQSKYCFGAKITLVCKSNYVNEIREANTNKRFLETNMIEDDKSFNDKLNVDNKFELVNDEIFNSQKFNMIKNFLKTESNRVKKIVNLKLKGYEWKEIAREFRITKRKAQNLWFYFIKKFRNVYSHKIDAFNINQSC